MKAKELMIGDWAQGFLPDTQLKVVGIPNEYRLAVVTSNCTYIELSRYDCKPIPITPEILLENFPSTKDGVLWWKDEDGIHIESEIDGDIMFSGIFHYVHQLQHALRLAGIEKEIKL